MYKYDTVNYNTSGQHDESHKFVITPADEKLDADLEVRAAAGWRLHSLVQRPSGDLMAVYERWEFSDKDKSEALTIPEPTPTQENLS